MAILYKVAALVNYAADCDAPNGFARPRVTEPHCGDMVFVGIYQVRSYFCA